MADAKVQIEAINDTEPTIGHPLSEAMEGEMVGLLAEFEDVNTVYRAACRMRDAGYKYWDVHSPFPIHGIDHARGTPPTILPLITLGGGLTGLFGGLFLVWWANATNFTEAPVNFQGYPFFISGKPLFSLPANIPIIFETTILLAAIATFVGMLALNNLPMLYNPLFRNHRFRRATDDKLFIVVDAHDPQFNAEATAAFLREIGGRHVEQIWD